MQFSSDGTASTSQQDTPLLTAYASYHIPPSTQIYGRTGSLLLTLIQYPATSFSLARTMTISHIIFRTDDVIGYHIDREQPFSEYFLTHLSLLNVLRHRIRQQRTTSGCLAEPFCSAVSPPSMCVPEIPSSHFHTFSSSGQTRPLHRMLLHHHNIIRSVPPRPVRKQQGSPAQSHNESLKEHTNQSRPLRPPAQPLSCVLRLGLPQAHSAARLSSPVSCHPASQHSPARSLHRRRKIRTA